MFDKITMATKQIQSCIGRKNCDGLSSLSSSFISACRMRWFFVCAVYFRHSCWKEVNGFARFKALNRKTVERVLKWILNGSKSKPDDLVSGSTSGYIKMTARCFNADTAKENSLNTHPRPWPKYPYIVKSKAYVTEVMPGEISRFFIEFRFMFFLKAQKFKKDGLLED
ncbi:hypothetical protein T11_15194 [Trichinella zimbabwensis]|uniref:Uncharacterized protein n=1 Tax=Trichinella zimbabwensis TaxID=268475 RepID=A0A0V1H4Y2_9BILA|nr:hypothetical protein T11_15194 [Trichinella zimbabwensis]